MSAISDCIRFRDYMREQLQAGKHPLSVVLRYAPAAALTQGRSQHQADGPRQPMTDDDARKASAMRVAGASWDQVEEAVGFTRPAIVRRAQRLGIPTSPVSQTITTKHPTP